MSAEAIRNRLAKYITNLDNESDVTQGPIYDLMLQPLPEEIDLGAENAQRLLSLYGRISDPTQLKTTEMEAVAKNLRVSRVSGSKATVELKFVLATKPTTATTIPAGTAVSTADFKYVFITDYAVTVTPDNSYAFYNSRTGRYEAYITASAQNNGSGYNLPINRINTLIKAVPSIAAVSNTVAASGGTDASDDASFYTRIQRTLIGLDPTSLAAYFNAIEAKTSYRDFSLFVPASDRARFKRRVVGNAYDVYVGSPSYATYADETAYVSGDQVFTLRVAPVYEIQYVMVNSDAIPLTNWSLIRDTSAEYAGSTLAKNRIKITQPLSIGDTVSIYYTVNKNCVAIQEALESLNPQGVSFLVREMKQVPLKITLALSVTQVASSLIDSATELVSNLCNGGQVESLSPYDLQSLLSNSIPSVRTVSVSELRRRSDTASSVQTVNLGFDEIASLDTTNGDLVITAMT